MSKVYVKATSENSFEWVDSPAKITHPEPDKQAAEVTLKRFKSAQLVEIPAKTPQTTSHWVISMDK
jgi:hypothetical protein